MIRPTYTALGRRPIIGATLAVTLLSGCSLGGSKGPGVIDAEATSLQPPTVDALTVAARSTWGEGRAVRAVTLPGGGSVIATTTGVFHVAAADAEPVRLDSFDSVLEVGPITVSPDGTHLAVTTDDPATLRTYDLTTGAAAPPTALPAGAAIRSASYDSTGTQLAVDTTVGPVVVAAPGAAPALVAQVAAAGTSAALPDGTLLTPITGTTGVVVTRAGVAEMRSLTLDEGMTVLDAHASPDGTLIAVSIAVGSDPFDRSDQIRVFDAATLEQRTTIDAGRVLDPPSWIITGDSVVVAAGGAVSAWTTSGEPLPVTAPTKSTVTDFEVVSDGLLTGHADGTLVHWSASTLTPTMILPGGTPLLDITIDGSRTLATTVDQLGTVTVRSVADGATVTTDERYAVGEATGVAIAPDDDQISLAASTGRVTLLDADLGSPEVFAASDGPARIGSVAYDPGTEALATGLEERRSELAFDDSVTMWDTAGASATFRVGGESEDVAGCAFFYSRVRFSPDGTQMAVASHDFSVVVVAPGSGEVLHELTATTTVLDLDFTDDGELLVATYDDGSVNVWDTADYSVAATYRGAQGGYFGIATLPDSATMAATDITGSITLVDIMTGETVGTFGDASYRTSLMAISHDGALIAVPTAEGGVGIWSAASGNRLATIGGHTAQITGIAFAAQRRVDGNHLGRRHAAHLDAHPRLTSPTTPARNVAYTAMSARSATHCLAFEPSRAVSAGSSSRRTIADRSAAGSAGGTYTPVSPSMTVSV